MGNAVEIEGNFLKCHVKELKANFYLMAQVNLCINFLLCCLT